MSKIDTVVGCPSTLQPCLDVARERWSAKHLDDHRPFQAAEVLECAARLCETRSWDHLNTRDTARLGLWLLETALEEDVTGRRADLVVCELGTLTDAEIEMIRASRAARR